MLIHLPDENFHTFDLVRLVRSACDQLSDLGVQNYVHQTDEVSCWVELVDLAITVTPEIDFPAKGIRFNLPE